MLELVQSQVCKHCGQRIKDAEGNSKLIGSYVHLDGLFACFGKDGRCLGTTAEPKS